MELKEAQESENIILPILRIYTDRASYLRSEEKLALLVI